VTKQLVDMGCKAIVNYNTFRVLSQFSFPFTLVIFSLDKEMMNIFRLSADLTHLASIFILLAKIRQSRSCVGEFHLQFASNLEAKPLSC
jgi:hypothetical protein